MKTNVLKTQLQQIRELIREQHYDEARAGLGLLNHPIAKRWLAKLDEIAPPSSTSALPWRRICFLAIRHPSRETFETIAADPGASALRASAWVFFSTFAGLAVTFLIAVAVALTIFGALPGITLIDISPALTVAAFFCLTLGLTVLILRHFWPKVSIGQLLLVLLLIFLFPIIHPIAFIVCLIISLGTLATFWMGVGTMHIVTRILGGKGSASRLAFAVASFTSLSLLFLPLYFLVPVFPIIQTMFTATNLYCVMLTIIAVAAVNRFGWVKSFAAGLTPIAASLALAVGIHSATVRFIVQGPAMYPTLQADVLILISRINYMLAEPEREDIVVFHVPGQPDEEPPYIKRVIGLPGETIEIRETQVYINGAELVEPYINGPCIPERCVDHTWVLGPDEYFVMGDNRNHSSDSRAFGPVGRDRLIGEAIFVYWPPSEWGPVE